MDAMLRDLRSAKQFIYMEYFIIEEGCFWGEILDILKPKYRKALETLGLNACISVLSDEFESYLETADEAVINIPCTRESPNPGSKIVTNVRMRPKTLNIYIHRFRGILRG